MRHDLVIFAEKKDLFILMLARRYSLLLSLLDLHVTQQKFLQNLRLIFHLKLIKAHSDATPLHQSFARGHTFLRGLTSDNTSILPPYQFIRYAYARA
jgi:hypothetical protein